MPTTDLNQRVSRLVGLEKTDLDLLTAKGIKTEEDLGVLEFVDLDESISVVKRRKLNLLMQYIAAGAQLGPTTTIADAKAFLDAARKQHQQQQSSSVRFATPVVDPDRGAPKVYTDMLPSFSGDPVDYEDWERKAGATIRQTAYRKYLTRPATKGDVAEEARSSELYNMILQCVGDGHALNTVEKARDDNNGLECGHEAWQALKSWYLDDSQKNQMIEHYESKLRNLSLDNDTTATEFINHYEMYVRKLEKLEGDWSDDKKVREFKARVTSDLYDTECRVHTGDFKDLVKIIRKRETDLADGGVANKRQRRFKHPDNEEKKDDASGNKSFSAGGGEKVPFIPKFLLRSMTHQDRKNLVNWRVLTNAGKTMNPDDLFVDKSKEKDSGNTDLKRTTQERLAHLNEVVVARELADSRRLNALEL